MEDKKMTEDEITVKCFEIYQQVIYENFIEDWESGKLKNKGEVQLAIAMEYFRVEIAKRKLLKQINTQK